MKKLILIMLIAFSIVGVAQPLVIAHRGASFTAPENTLSAYKIAFNNNCRAAECDIYMTKDNKIVLSHDRTLKRIAGVDIDITLSNYNDLQSYDVGSFKSEKYKNERIPLLSEVIDILPENAQLFIEIKDTERILNPLKELIANSGKNKNVSIIAFDYEVLRKSKELMPDIPHHWLIHLESQKSDAMQKVKDAKLDGINASYKILDANFIKEVHDAWYKVFTWTINDIIIAENLKKMGIDGITTDRPIWMQEFFNKKIFAVPQIFAHNDYENTNPLFDAISNGCVNIEIDVHNIDGKLFVSHDKPDINKAKTVEELYLMPLRNLLMESQGELYKNYSGELSFMFDIKGDAEETYKILKSLFIPYKDYISRVDKGEFKQGILRVFVSGNMPIETIQNDELQIIGFDGRPNMLGKGIPNSIQPIISDNWFNVIKWDGVSELKPEDTIILDEIIKKAEAENKHVRLWGSPDNQKVWEFQLQKGIKIINTDKIPELREFLLQKGDYYGN